MKLGHKSFSHKRPMRRLTAVCAAACCATALFAGCTGNNAQPGQPESATAAPQQGTSQAAPALRTLLDTTMRYSANSLGAYIPMVLPNSACVVATRLDFSGGVQHVLCTQDGCDHTSAQCTAYIGVFDPTGHTAEATRLLADEERLFRFQERSVYADPAVEFPLQISDVDGANVRRVCDSFVPFNSMMYVYLSDGENLYTTVKESDTTGAMTSLTLYAADMKNSTLRTVCNLAEAAQLQKNDADYWLIGSADGKFLYHTLTAGSQLVSMQDTPEEMAQNLDAEERDIRHSLLTVDASGAVQQSVLTWTGADYKVVSAPNGSVIYGLDTATGAFVEQNIFTGEKNILCNTLPLSDMAQMGPLIGDIQFFELTNRGAVPGEISITGYGVNVKTGEMHQITHEMVMNGTRRPMNIIAFGGETLLVQTEEKLSTQMQIGNDGIPYETPATQPVYALISLADYVGGTPNFTDCAMLDGMML